MPKVQPYKNKAGKYGWRRIADNGQVIGTDGGQGYENTADMARMARAEAEAHGDTLDWSQLPSSANPDTLIDNGDDNDTNDGDG